MDTGDFPPTDPDDAVFRELAGSLKQILSRLEQVMETDLKQFNDQLAARKLTRVTVK